MDDNTLLGLNAPDAIQILSSGATSLLWVQVISQFSSLQAMMRHRPRADTVSRPAAFIGVLAVASLITPPSALGSERSFLHKTQKSGLVTITLAFVTFILGIVSFALEMIVILPARNKLNAVPGITCKLVRGVACWLCRTTD